MKVVYGHTAITCRRCGTMTVIDNKALEVTEHKCPKCGQPMTDREMARMKMHLYLLWTQMYNDNCGPLFEAFDYDIDLHPRYAEDLKETKENGNREGDLTSENK